MPHGGANDKRCSEQSPEECRGKRSEIAPDSESYSNGLEVDANTNCRAAPADYRCDPFE